MPTPFGPTITSLLASIVSLLSVPLRFSRPVLKVEICSKCHPFMTGKQKIIDTAGRVDRFKKKYAAQEAAKDAAKEAARGGKAE